MVAIMTMTTSSMALPFNGISDNPRVVNKKSLGELRELLTKVKGIKDLRGTGLSVVETTTGETFAISNNGRYVMHAPKIIDTWNGAVIDGVDDMADLERVNLSLLKIDLNDLASFVYGKADAPETVIFIDPYCPYCERLIKQVQKLGDKHRFRIVVVPILTPESQKTAKELVCMSRQEGLKAILGGNFKQLPQPSSICTDEPIQRALVVFQVFGANSVPFSILPSGRFVKGFIGNLEKAISDDLARANERAAK